METKQKNYKKWIAALVLAFSLTAAGSAFAAETWRRGTIADVVTYTGENLFRYSFRLEDGSMATCNGGDMFSVLPGSDGTTFKMQYAQILMVKALNKTVQVWLNEDETPCTTRMINFP